MPIKGGANMKTHRIAAAKVVCLAALWMLVAWSHPLRVTAGGPPPPEYTLPFGITHLEADPVRNRVYISDKDNRKVYFINPGIGAVEAVFEFDLTPERMAVAPDGSRLYVALLTREHSDDWTDGEGHEGVIAVFDLENDTKEKAFWINEDPYDLVATTDGKLIVSSGSGQWTHVRIYDVDTENELGSAAIRQRSRLSLHPNQSWVYAADADISPTDIRKYLIDAGGITALYDSPYHGDHRMWGNVYAAPSGEAVVTRGGDVFRATGEQATDMTYIDSLTTTTQIDDLVFYPGDAVFTLESTSNPPAGSAFLRYYQLTGAMTKGEYPLSEAPQFLAITPGYLHIFRVTAGTTTVTNRPDPLHGDINGDFMVDLHDAVVALNALSGAPPLQPIFRERNVDGDGKIGHAEAIHALRTAAGMFDLPPVLDAIGNKSVTVNALLSFQISGNDPEGHALVYSADNLPEGATIDGVSGMFTWQPDTDQSGNYTVTVIATDNHGHSDSETITITVVDVPTVVISEFFPIQVGDWWQYRDTPPGTVSLVSVSGTKPINGLSAFVFSFEDGQKEYYTVDSQGLSMHGSYVVTPEYTGEVVFSPPLRLIEEGAVVGHATTSSSIYSIVLQISGTGPFPITVDVSSTVTFQAVEDVVTAGTTLKGCFRFYRQISQYIRETAQTTVSPDTFWLYPGVGVVKQTMDGVTSIITQSHISGMTTQY